MASGEPTEARACRVCAAVLPDGSQFCPACGTRITAASDIPTQTGDWIAPIPHANRLLSSDAAVASGFAPGVVLGGRFRIIGLLGVGGMGEVYRADDLKLGQAVALKFLPEAVASSPARRDRFYAEVRFARQVSHPNVCRVYDIDDIDGRQFLSMEFIDGEDLASLLKRIGHLPAAKVLEIAHQLCAGLAAAHRRGVLHRDLKPANVMVDGRGYARITDFGLAVADDGTRTGGKLQGTPLYMAPELFTGQNASARSDIYALGLVLYELCTGTQPFKARTIDELRLEKNALVPRPPSELARDVDPLVERVILRCIDRDPQARPASVLQVAAALPGGDPLAAALAAGETPSPEMVAASAGSESLRPALAWALVAGLVVCTAAAIWLGGRAVMTRRVPLERPPAAFVERARGIAERAGYADPPADSAFGVAYNDAYLQSVEARDRSPSRWRALSAQALRVWYRQSRAPLERLAFSIGVSPTVTPTDPPLGQIGDLLVVLNGDRRLVALTAVPPVERGTPAPDPRAPPAVNLDTRWVDLFRDAGLTMSEWVATEPQWTPLYWADARYAWQPAAPDGSEEHPLRVEASSVLGRPIEFLVVYPWDRPDRRSARDLFYDRGFGAQKSGLATRTASLIGIGLTAVAMFGGLFVARRNLRQGRGDRRGASRLVAVVTLLLTVSWILDEHHVAGAHEWYLLVSFAGRALVLGGIFWWTYVAFEPYVRRHWPAKIVSWSRLLTGDVRDPLIARDVLIGLAAGAFLTCVLLVSHLMPGWLGGTAERLATPTWHAWLGPGQAVSLAFQLVCNALLDAFTALFVLVLVRFAVRHELAAALVAAALLATPDVLLSENPAIAALFFFTIYLLGLLLLMRVGLLAVIALRFCVDLLQVYPIVLDPAVWYSSIGIGALALLAALVALCVHTTLTARAAPPLPVRQA